MEVEYKVICFSDLFNHSETGQKVMEALSETKDLSLFRNETIKIIIDYKYSLVRTAILDYLFKPYVNYLFTFFIWHRYIYEYNGEVPLRDHASNKFVSLILLMYALYFSFFEIDQFRQVGFKYFLSFWNLFDTFPAISISIMVIWFNSNETRFVIEPATMAISSLIMWSKLLNFLRISQETGYLIRMMIKVINDIGVFIFVLFFTLLGFADAMYIISRSNMPPEDESDDSDKYSYFSGYFSSLLNSYLLALGEFQYEDFSGASNEGITWFIFLIATLLNCVVMLNLLIAIVSETFNNVLS